MPSSLSSRLDQDEDLQLAIALTKSLMVGGMDGGEDDAVESNQPDKPQLMEEEEHEERLVAEQLQAFLIDAQRVLRAADATGDDLHALIPYALRRPPACMHAAKRNHRASARVAP